MRCESGQATVEWVGLVLVAALVLGALTAVRAPSQERDLGRTLAARISCAAAGSCAAGPAAPRPGPAPGESGAIAPSAGRDGRTRRRAARARTAESFRRLRGAGEVAKRVWIVCLGYRRVLYELDHPRAPTEAMPFDEGLDIANACFNPASFLEFP